MSNGFISISEGKNGVLKLALSGSWTIHSIPDIEKTILQQSFSPSKKIYLRGKWRFILIFILVFIFFNN